MSRRQKGDHKTTVFHRFHGTVTRLDAELPAHIALDHHLVPVSHSCHASKYADE